MPMRATDGEQATRHTDVPLWRSATVGDKLRKTAVRAGAEPKLNDSSLLTNITLNV